MPAETIDLGLMQYKDLLELKKVNGKAFIYDPLRRKWLVLEPEEMVRQLVVQYLIREKGYNKARIKMEKGFKFNELRKRCDVLVYDDAVNPFLMVECKNPGIKITDEVIWQITWYKLPFEVPYLLVTNGEQSYCCVIDYAARTFEYLSEVPYSPDT